MSEERLGRQTAPQRTAAQHQGAPRVACPQQQWQRQRQRQQQQAVHWAATTTTATAGSVKARIRLPVKLPSSRAATPYASAFPLAINHAAPGTVSSPERPVGTAKAHGASMRRASARYSREPLRARARPGNDNNVDGW
ncbi:uncharacterized protein K452DRAFT_286821 [Aplosporella prunicola CBS 121167]|uniref:Uncharacterized protein n=1 Tax=Aplosporella prunicola CBS 121167 TaxID=1176127 RepID=A0A6A6BDZ7_9PEZI|nr:uncharacterized protein K452DRAFT_286821 [Aplosporella prunicola CBS 121167]KAF2142399.1 hypothetical protein K452DRAFT_286821 [Aplosporella prunicola CBS 121167]